MSEKVTKPPLVSLIIPCLNEAGVVNELLDQLTAQEDQRLEIIAVDNKSSDDTLAILSSYKTSGVRVVSGIEEGVSRARNAGAKIATGTWLVFLDADSTVPQGFIADLLQLVEGDPSFDLAALAYRAQTTNVVFRALTVAAQAYQRGMFHVSKKPLVPGSFVLVRADLHRKIGGYDEKIRYNEDFEYSTRAYKACGSFKSLHAPFVYFSMRRLEHGGWRGVLRTYLKAEYERMRGRVYDPKEYDMSDHTMKK